MHKKAFWTIALAVLAFCVVLQLPHAENAYSQGGRPQVTPEQLEKRRAIENELQSIAIVERKLMIPMRDGVRIATDVYRPKDSSKKYPTIFVRTPYNFNYWDIRNSAPRDLSSELEAVKRGYAFVEMNERGRFFSEGNYDILGPPLTDGVDEFNWISKQTWSNGKVG
jgi:predicted acyl esterase